MNFSVRSVVTTAVSILLLTFVVGCGANVSSVSKVSKPAKPAVSAKSKATQVKLARMGEMCEHNIAIKALAKSGTTRDVGWRASKISALAKKLKYGSVAFYAGQVKEAAYAGKVSGIKTLTGAVSANIKLDRSKKTYGKCSCKKVFKCKNKKKKKK